MALLQGGVDTSSIALWLGHESPASTHIYVDANLALKEQILAKMGTWDGTKIGLRSLQNHSFSRLPSQSPRSPWA
jgi:hypothetical protein